MTRFQRHYYDGIRLSFEGQQELAYREFLAMAELSPLHSASGLTEMGLMTNHIDTAIEAASWLEKGNGEFHEPFVTFWQGYWSLYTYALHLGGQYEKELEIAREWKGRFPASSFWPTMSESYANIGLGRVENLDAVVEDWRAADPSRLEAIWSLSDDLWVHGHREKARSILEEEVQRFETDPAYRGRFNNQAMVLHRLGRDEEAHRLWEAGVNLNRPDPWPWGVGRLGFSAALTGDTVQAREMDRLLDEIPEEQEPYKAFLQAQVAAALGEKDRAVRILTDWGRRGVVLFWLNNLHRDFTLQSLLGDYPPFQELLRPKE
jgi:tetratricopeptide (TPR) repeat protein